MPNIYDYITKDELIDALLYFAEIECDKYNDEEKFGYVDPETKAYMNDLSDRLMQAIKALDAK